MPGMKGNPASLQLATEDQQECGTKKEQHSYQTAKKHEDHKAERKQ